jgi:hypothetical protein
MNSVQELTLSKIYRLKNRPETGWSRNWIVTQSNSAKQKKKQELKSHRKPGQQQLQQHKPGRSYLNRQTPR